MESNPKHRDQRHAVNVRLSLTVPNENKPEIRDKLCIYFQSKQGGNCNVEYVRLMGEDANGSWYRVAFDKPSGVSHVLSRSDHVIIVDGVKIPLEVQCCPPAPPGTSVSSSAETSSTRPHPNPSDAADIQIENEYAIGSAQENLQVDPEEEDEKLIEVTGLKLTKDDEVLKLCFENPRTSGGGEIEMFGRDILTPDAIRITFTNPSAVISMVAEKEHKSGVTLKVKLITKKKRPPLSIMPRCLFLKGIPEGCTTEYLKLFMEHTTAMDEEPMIQYGEKPGTAICTFSCNIPDLDAVLGRVSKKKIKGVSVKAEKVQQPGAILVQGVSQDLEIIELYFDNKKKSGGGGVTYVQPGPMDGQAIVSFEDWKVARDVLANGPHKLGGTELLVESYHDFLGRLSQSDAPTPHIPKPVSVQVQEPIMEFLYGKGGNIKKLVEELTKVKASLQWPYGYKKSQAKLEPVIDDSQRQSSWLNWNKEAEAVLTDFMKGYKTARVLVPQSLWEDAADTLKKIAITCSMVPDTQHYAVILVGEQQDVNATEAKVNDIIKKLQEAEYDAEQAKEDIYWDAEKLQLFTLCGIKQEIEKSFPALKITVFSSYGKTGITLDGIRKTIKEVELQLRKMMDSLEKAEFKAGSIKVRFVQHVPDKIHEVLGSRNIRAACSGSDNGKITIYGATSKDVRKAKAYIDDEIDEDMIAIKGQSALAVIQGHDGKKLLDLINNQKFVMACISHETGARCIELAGFKRNLNETKKLIINFLKKNVIIKSIIPSNKSKVCLITTFHGRELERVRQQHQQNLVAIQPQMSGRNRGFIIQGNEEGLEAVRQLVTSLVEAVKEKQYPVSKTGMARLFREEKGQKFLESVEKKFHCVIKNTDFQEESSDEEEEEEGAGQSPTATQILDSVTLPESTCRLRVCQGDLTRQRVDCIVNAANVKLEHIGGLAAAVLEADYVTKKVSAAILGTEDIEDDKKEDELQETVILQLCAMDMNSLMKASDKLDKFQDEEFLSEDFPDPMGLIDQMYEEDFAELKQIGRKHNVTTEPTKGRAKNIHVEGQRINVKDAMLDISQMFTRIQKEETDKQKMEHLAKEVKWTYSTPSGTEDYGEEINAMLEEAYQKKKLNIMLDLEDGRAIIDLQQMQETFNGRVVNVHRVDLKKAARFETPSNWIPMQQGELTKMVTLTAGSPEYTAVETRFRLSVGVVNQIIEIQRVQNQDLMMQYQARRAALESRLNKTNIEEVLYHGTDEQTSKKISMQGFNRSFCGKNATAYGNGTYFAVTANYSAQPQYAKPNAYGTKHIFVTNVLVGDYVRGSQGMMVSPNKPHSLGELFDSVVDNMTTPGIYVIFHDAQAYPKYLIKFRWQGTS